MKTIVTITLNPAIDKSASVDQVVAERNLYYTPPRFEPGPFPGDRFLDPGRSPGASNIKV